MYKVTGFDTSITWGSVSSGKPHALQGCLWSLKEIMWESLTLSWVLWTLKNLGPFLFPYCPKWSIYALVSDQGNGGYQLRNLLEEVDRGDIDSYLSKYKKKLFWICQKSHKSWMYPPEHKSEFYRQKDKGHDTCGH